MNTLTDKQQLFITEYLQLFNATEAAKRAGYSEKTAYAIGWENLRKPEIAEVIRQELEASAMSAAEVLRRLADQARGELTKYITADGELDLEAIRADDKGHLLKRYSRQRRTIRKKGGEDIEIDNLTAELYDAQSALTILAKHHKLMSERVEVDGRIQVFYVNDWRGNADD